MKALIICLFPVIALCGFIYGITNCISDIRHNVNAHWAALKNAERFDDSCEHYHALMLCDTACINEEDAAHWRQYNDSSKYYFNLMNKQ